MSSISPILPTLSEQAERLIELGVHRIAGLTADRLRSVDADGDGERGSRGLCQDSGTQDERQ